MIGLDCPICQTMLYDTQYVTRPTYDLLHIPNLNLNQFFVVWLISYAITVTIS